MVGNADRSSVYTTIYNSLRHRIFTGLFQPGDMLPSESQLCREFSASRETVRKGLKQLDNEGLVYSRPKVGYFVCTPNQTGLKLRQSEQLKDCSTQYCDIHGIMPEEWLQEKLGIPADRKVIELSQITRSTSGEALAYEVKYVPYERAYPSVESEMHYAVLPDITFSKISSYEYYTEVTISATTTTERTAEMLECPPGTPLLLTEELFIRQDGQRIGYSRRYSRGQAGILQGISGHVLK